jgi:hypothetical protein
MRISLFISLFLFLNFTSKVGANIFEKQLSIHKDKPIKLVLLAQEEAWNKGDLDGFMQHYWNSTELQFVSKNGVKKGWQSVYDSYQKSYAAKGEMGKLNFQVLSIQTIDKNNAMVTGTWKVENTTGIHQGYFTLWFKNIKGKWLIVMDHTS